ncbi:baseplate J/gp47 family protein [Variovorax sp. OV700]|uniref:baseplate assembly protein n=1 Tax=Variovorax sp. OV700 TaxID=1882826 RepID=UPI00087E258F|nr:baseplate J/gp47 family protein [Variovorax sp. OV700]SDI78131.1 Phage-related baseplate assembly protein [Variovorax sp. OV700]
MTIDMSQLPAPQVIEPLDYETIYQRKLAEFQAAYPDFTLVLESDPAVKLLEVIAYQELVMRQRINDAAKACMLAYAVGADLDNQAANLGVTRLEVTPANLNAVPPIEAVMESDDRLRERAQMAFEGLTTAGPIESYRFHAMTASAHVVDAGVDSPLPGTVRVSILTDNDSGLPDEAQLTLVRNALNQEKIRPLCDLVTVQAAQILESPIVAVLHRKNGPVAEVAEQAGRIALDKWLVKIRKLGAGLARSGIDAALHQPGIDRVELTSPAVDVLCDRTQWVRVSSITITEEVTNE